MHVDITFPDTYEDNCKVPVIKCMRELTGMGLKETKDMCEIPGTIRLNFPALDSLEHRHGIEQILRDLARCGVRVGYYGLLVDSLRKSAADALAVGEDDIANNVLQHVLALKLKYGI